ncbi:Tetratricopeptide-like helical [Penicillium paradoxum]|uniref:Tetratricopeptide-like helical n=1 Tax=Penicillium paradoxum TaxID=176176 RepID=UPI002546D184|nr:Tetratricopeptide-like helical [Penicillium paradoxum]KAJ5782371.1 Tetratricopeptide-like helical [Penicillium paradoxum]
MDKQNRLYEAFPGPDIVRPPAFPKRPDIFNTVPLGPALTEDDAFLARQFWQQPDDTLGLAWKAHPKRPFTRAKNEEGPEMHVLAHNVYEHLMSNPFLPISREDARDKFNAEGLGELYNGVQGLDAVEQKVFIHGLNVKDPSLWTKEAVKEELLLRGLNIEGKKVELQQRLWEYECDERFGVLKQSNLQHWGISRESRPVMRPAMRTDMTALEMYTAAIKTSPYNPTYWNSRAYCHYLLGYFDLAIGDAYRGELLCEVLTTASQRNKRPGLYTRVWDAIQLHLMMSLKIQGVSKTDEVKLMRKANGVNYFIPTLRNALHSITSLSLAALNCWDDFTDHMEGQLRRPLAHRDASVPRKRLLVSEPIRKEMEKRRRNPTKLHQSLYGHEWSRGWISGAERYPYDQGDVQREAPDFLTALNANLITASSSTQNFLQKICQVLPLLKPDNSFNGLGVFATTNIRAGTLIHYEEPVIRGHLIPNALVDDGSEHPLHAQRCDNCQKKIKPSAVEHIENNWDLISGQVPDPKNLHSTDCVCRTMICRCTNPGESRGAAAGLLFCPLNHVNSRGVAPDCLEIARETYHFSEFCGIEWGWLHDAMRPNKETWSDTEYFSHNNERHGTILSLLLKSVFELTLHRRKDDPNLLAHEINELLVLESGTDSNKPWKDSWFPFTLAANIQVPFDILLNLGVDVFCDLSFDTWVIQTVLRKLLVNAVPWERARRNKNSTFTQRDGPKPVINPITQNRMRDRGQDFTAMDPSFENLYVFPGLSMFNHSCRFHENAQWGFDQKVPNRIVLWASKDIHAGEEIRVPYQRYRIADPVGEDPDLNMHANQLFGKNCQCPRCQGRGLTPRTSFGGNTALDDGSADWTPGPVTYPPKGEYWDELLREDDSDLDEYLEVTREIVDDIFTAIPEVYRDSLSPERENEKEEPKENGKAKAKEKTK